MEAILTICRISQRDCGRFNRRLVMATNRYALIADQICTRTPLNEVL